MVFCAGFAMCVGAAAAAVSAEAARDRMATASILNTSLCQDAAPVDSN